MIKDNEEEKRKVKNALYSHGLSSFIALMMVFIFILINTDNRNGNHFIIMNIFVGAVLIGLILYFISPFSSYIIILIVIYALFKDRKSAGDDLAKFWYPLVVFLILTFLFQLRVLANSNYKLPYTGYHTYKILTK